MVQKSEIVNEVLLSIILPTKNRYDTLFVVLDSIVENIIGVSYEVIIQDNSDDNIRCLEYLEKRKSSHLKYFYNPVSIPISDNTELAFENSTGKFLVFIGDDDFIAPNIIEITKILDEREIDVLIYNPAYYWWESITFSKPDYYNKPKNFWLPQQIDFEFVKVDPTIELEKTLKKGAMAYDRLPRLYHGITSRKQLNKLKAKIGRYIAGSCPDMDLAVSLALNIDEYFHLNFPVTVFGASKNSGGGWTALKKHFGSIEQMPFLRPTIKDAWNTAIPRIWSERTIYPQTTTEVLKAYNTEKEVNLIPLYAAMIVYEPKLERKIVQYIIRYCGYNPVKYAVLVKELTRKIAGAFLTKIKRKFKKMPFEVINDVQPTQIALILKEKFLSR